MQRLPCSDLQCNDFRVEAFMLIHEDQGAGVCRETYLLLQDVILILSLILASVHLSTCNNSRIKYYTHLMEIVMYGMWCI